MSIINTIEEAKKFAETAEVGSQWVFDGWPEPPTSEAEIDTHAERGAKAAALLEEITKIIESAVAPKAKGGHPWVGLTAEYITKNNKKNDVIDVAKELGVSIYKANGKTIDTELNIAKNIVKALQGAGE